MSERPKLGQLLLGAGAIDEAQLTAALAEQSRWGRPLGTTLLQMGFLEEETLIRTLARQLKLPVAWLRGKRIRPDVLALVPHELVEKHRCLPVLVDQRAGKTLLLAMEDPADLGAADEVSFRTGMKVRAVLAAPSELDDAIERHYPSGGGPIEAGSAPPGERGASPADGQPEPELLSLGRGEPESLAFGPPDSDLGDSRDFGKPSDPGAGAPSGDAVVRALAQLLVEKGVISREELVERLSSLSARGEENPGA